jgi:GNAT superfamily N-acetyltransferase
VIDSSEEFATPHPHRFACPQPLLRKRRERREAERAGIARTPLPPVPTPAIALASTEKDIRRCYPVLHQLRTHLDEPTMLAQILRQQADGYLLAYCEIDNEVRSVAGYRYSENLAYGKFMYVDDLVTRNDDRSKGFGKLLFDWLVAQAKAHGCAMFALDSGVHRFDAHRFYLVNRMNIVSHHFTLRLS